MTQVATTPPPATLAKREPPSTIKGLLGDAGFLAQISKALPKHMTAERQLRVALTALTRTPKLAECSLASFARCMLDCSAMGLEPDGRRAHLIPYGKDCTLVVDYKGKVELAFRSGVVAKIHADVVCENDVFDYDRGEVKAHKIELRKPRGEAYAAYCIVTFKDGAEKADVMSKDDIERIRARSKSGRNGPWVTDWNEMAKKTVLHRVLKLVPLSPEIRESMDKDDDSIDIHATPVADTASSFTAMLEAPADDPAVEAPAAAAESSNSETKS